MKLRIAASIQPLFLLLAKRFNAGMREASVSVLAPIPSSLRETHSISDGIVRFVADALSNRELRALKARAQLLKPMLKVGKDGLSPAFLKAVHDALDHHELVKVKFDEFKEQKKELGPKLAQAVAAHVVMQVGHVIVLFQRKIVGAAPV